MRSSVFSLLLLLCAVLPAQSGVSSIVADQLSREVIPYTSVSILGKATGTVGDIDGRFVLQSIQSGEVILCSALGYQSSKVTFEGQSLPDTIFMNPAPYMIETIRVSGSNLTEEVMLGIKNKERGPSLGFGNAQLGTELGALIAIDKETYLKSANFRLNHAKGDSLLLRINIYDYSHDTIGPNLLTENVLIQEKQRPGNYSIDISAYNLVVDHNVLMSVEWLRNFDENGNKDITFDVKKSRKLRGAYIRSHSNGPFRLLPYNRKYKPCFYFIGLQ